MKTALRVIALSLFVGTLAACMPQAAPTSMPTPTGSVPAAATPLPALTTSVTTASPTAAVNAATATAAPAASPTAPAGPTASTSPTATSGINVRLNEPFTLKVGQWANLLDASSTRVFFTSLREDTRCPVKPSSRCDGVGRALIAISMESNARLAQVDLSSNSGEFRALSAFNGYIVQLIDVAPYPQQTEPKIALGDYQVTLRVSAGSLDVAQARFLEPFTLKVGQTIGVDGSSMRLTFAAVTQDSRCPARVLCVTRGTATVAIVATHDGATYHYSLEVGGSGVMTSFPAVRTVSVIIYARALTPYPQQEFASKEIAANEYQVTLLVDNPALPLPSPTPRKP